MRFVLSMILLAVVRNCVLLLVALCCVHLLSGMNICQQLMSLVLGRLGSRFGGLGARLDGHLGGPRDGLDGILGPLERLRRLFLDDFEGPKRVRKGDFLDPKWTSAK